MYDDMTYSMLVEMVVKKFKLDPNDRLNLSVKLHSFDSRLDITDDDEIRMFVNHLRPLLNIYASHLKGLYKGTNLLALGMDGNNYIVPIAFGLYWKICKAYTPDEFTSNMNILQAVHPDAYNKLIEVGHQRWSRAHCPLTRYNYTTSNSMESVNACNVLKRKLLITMLTETYRAMVQELYVKCQEVAVSYL
ncbi:hypothetical protein Tco_1177762 [Tanacetum coccineum]